MDFYSTNTDSISVSRTKFLKEKLELTLHVTIENIPNSYFNDGNYADTEEYVKSVLQELATGLEGSLYDCEIK